MNTRLKTLSRLRDLYGVATHMHGVALEQASAAVRDAEERISAKRERAKESGKAGLTALSAGDTLDWMMHESERGFSERNAELLGGLRVEREASMQAAAAVYRSNRLQLEQMQSVLKGLRSELERERAHREQRNSDDRFLSRQRWQERLDAELKGNDRLRRGDGRGNQEGSVCGKTE